MEPLFIFFVSPSDKGGAEEPEGAGEEPNTCSLSDR